MILQTSIVILGLTAVVCTAALLVGDLALRVAASLIGVGALVGMAGQVDSDAISPDLVTWTDAASAGGLAVLLCTTNFRAWIPAALGAQSVILIIDIAAVVIDGRHLAIYFRGMNLMHGLLIAALAGGAITVAGRKRAALL